MKKLLTLVLCWLIAFTAMAETTFKAKTAASVAGGYVTSLNKIDGSFEDGSTQWSASVGTIVPTASTEFQGNYKGVWAGTGTGTLDLQWTATAPNTHEASAQVNVNGEDDVYVCAYVGTTETGCKLIPALNKIQKVSVVADSVISSAFYLRLKHTGSDAFNIAVDDGKIEPWTPQAVNLVQKESVSFKGTGLLTTTGTIRFPTSGFNRQWNNLATYDQSTGRLTSKVNGTFSGGISLIVNNAANRFYLYKNGSFVGISNTTTNATDYLATLPFSVDLNAGDYLTVETDGSVNITQSTVNSFSITATAISDNVVQSWQPSGSLGELKFLPQNIAPQGFIPALGSSIGKTAGTYQGDAYYDLYKVLWTQSSVTAGEPYVISSAKGTDAATDWAANKTITIDVSGLVVRAYKSGTTAAVGAKQADSLQGHNHQLFLSGGNRLNRTDTMGSGVTPGPGLATGMTAYPYAGTLETDGTNGTPRTASETRMTNIAQYAFIRYGNDAPTLLALPTSKNQSESAVFSNSGAISIASVSSDWISSISRSGVGTGTIDYTKLNLTKAPALFGTDLTGNGRIISFSSVTATSAAWKSESNSGSSADGAFNIKLEKQSPDYTAHGVFVGNVAKNQVAYVKDVKSSGTNGGAATAGLWLQRDLNTIEGDSAIVSLGTNTFTLQPGEYDIEAEAPVYTGGYHRIGLALSSSSTPDIALGSTEWSGSAGSYATTKSRLFKRITISSATTYKLLHRCSVSVVGSGLGTASNFGIDEVYTQVKITKLNGQ